MKIGDKVEIKITGEIGVLLGVEKTEVSLCKVRLLSGQEFIFNSLDIRRVPDESKKKKLLEKVRTGDGKAFGPRND